jgi:hypothetical protein
MRVVSTCIEVLLQDRLTNTDTMPIVQGGELSELVDDALDGIDGENELLGVAAAREIDDRRHIGTDDEEEDDDDDDGDDE